MKRKVLMLIGMLGLGISTALSQTYINSWENSLEGWSVADTANWTASSFSTTYGVMAGTYSWQLQNTTGNFDWSQNGTSPALTGPSSLVLTTNMANGSEVDLNVDIPNSGDFGWGFAFALYLNQPGGVGMVQIGGWDYQSAGPSSQIKTYSIPDSVRFGLLGNLDKPCQLILASGGGGAGTAYLDGLRIVPRGQINSWEDSTEGWTIVNTNFTIVGVSTTTGVTAGLYSLIVQNTTGNYLWNQDGTQPDFGGPSATGLTALLANAASVSMDYDVPGSGDFGWGCGFSLYVNQPGGAGLMTISQWGYWLPSGGPTNGIMTFAVPPAVNAALALYPAQPCYLLFCTGGGGPGTIYFDNLRVTLLPPTAANLWVRELWDDIGGAELIPANTAVGDTTSSVGFDPASSWVVNPAETANCALMAFRNFNNESLPGSLHMCLPSTLDNSGGMMVQENNGFAFFPGSNAPSFWTDGDFMTRQLAPANYINFQAEGEYWFSVTIANAPTSLNASYVTFPASGWGGLGFADGSTTNAHFVAIGVTGEDVYLGPTNTSLYHGDTNVSKALYVSQGTLGQPGDTNTEIYNPLVDPNADPVDTNSVYSQTNFSGGPYYIRAYSADSVGKISGDYITLLGHLTTHSNGTATLDAKYYGTGIGGNSWNTELDMNTNSITWDCSYSFSFAGTMTRMLVFENGQFPFYMFGFRASKNFQDVVGFDPGRIAVAPLANTYEGYPINMTNLAVEANYYSWASPPSGYNNGIPDYQWYHDGAELVGATSQYLNIANAVATNAGIYTCVATDPSGTWTPVTNSVTITVTHLEPPTVTGVASYSGGNIYMVYLDEPNLTGTGDTNHYVFSGGIGVAGVTVRDTGTHTEVQIRTTDLPEGTRITLTVSGITNAVGDSLVTTNITFWTDLIQTGYANWNCWLCPAQQNSAYWPTWLPANPNQPIVQSMLLTSWEGPSTGVTNVGLDTYVGDDFGANLTGWFVPPVTTNYVFFCYADDGARLSLSTNSSSTNMFVIACESDWSGADQWTNICNQYGQYGIGPHRGDGNATNWVGANNNYVWDNSFVAQSPATACQQNRSDQFIVAYYDSTGEPGGPPGATNSWAAAESKVEFCVPVGMTNFWPQRDVNGQALIHLQAGQKYFMKLEFMQNGGGYPHGVTYKIASEADPTSPSVSIMNGGAIAGLAPFVPTVSITTAGGVSQLHYTGVLLAGTTPENITAPIAISSNGVSIYNVPMTNNCMFYRTSR